MGNDFGVMSKEGEQHLMIQPEVGGKGGRLTFHTSFPKTLEGYISPEKYGLVLARLDKEINFDGSKGRFAAIRGWQRVVVASAVLAVLGIFVFYFLLANGTIHMVS